MYLAFIQDLLGTFEILNDSIVSLVTDNVMHGVLQPDVRWAR